ncbi:hypothetical protein [Yoonia sp. 208BN28-4]|uniref:hypothetical protein n=1 Tax=Yoonia sp. 208BN28-4 TaxID=3126505 RepID=UPI0030A9BD46
MTAAAPVWSAWQDHDGSPCPLPAGAYVEVCVERYPGDRRCDQGALVLSDPDWWDHRNWMNVGADGAIIPRIVSYRVRIDRDAGCADV